MFSRRIFVALAAALLAACAWAQQPLPPIVFVHGDGNNAALWQTTFWRFESNGWPRDRLYAIDVPYPQARGDDAQPQPGRSSAAENMAYLKSEVEKLMARTGAKQVVLVGNSRGGNAIRNFVENGGGATVVSHAVLGGTPNHGVWAVHIDGLPDTNEFAGHGPFLTALNKPKNAAGDEVTGPVKWLTIRSDKNDKFAQPDGLWIGKRGVETGVTAAGPELKGAKNVVIPRIDHRETSFSPAAFAATYEFITGQPPKTTAVVAEDRVMLSGRVTGLGVSSVDPASGNGPNNLPLPGAKLEVYAIDNVTGERRGAAAYSKTIGDDGAFGPFTTQPDTRYEFVVSADGYATTHIYRSPFPRSTALLRITPRRIAEVDKHAPSIVVMQRPRGYLDPGRDKMALDGISPPPGAVLGAGVDSSTVKPTGLPRAIVGEFNGERVVGRSWPAAENHVTVLELTD
jgi:pimeloyl-ACP methyl ester carboxylesterase